MNLTKQNLRTPLVTLSVFITLFGCSNQGYSVIANTGTTIGLGISQQPTNGAIDATFGYKRAEMAFVPTNRANNKNSAQKSHKDGASDVADVVMELHYNGGLDSSGKTGVYQRLAVGKEAVKATSSSALFAKGPDGSINENVIEQLKTVEVNPNVVSQLKPVLDKYSNKVNQPTIDGAAKQLGFDNFIEMYDSNNTTVAQVNALKEILMAKGILKSTEE
ncbi:hypothetical protein [Photobacterium sp. OFAV2-7]|uniref:hypothetical protein n=1 Tax=Photobacterium sp. OFAV2-7 TaxID=2917748 RepID=UPI001EF4D284|nr:hypothetical protein [Photobacterium sp. OFAV2-7]MCG7585180.1 hypothetical protein [Photobacterium sp. OFAV2-7]